MAGAIKVYFATNRNRLADQNGQANFGELAGTGVQGIAYGAATVENVALETPNAGTITACSVVNLGSIGQDLSAQILAEDKDIVVFIHGAANTFRDSIQRAAFNCNWINQEPGRGVVVLVFSWPARHYKLWDLVSDLVNYRLDQAQAQASETHFVEFIQSLYRFQPSLGGRRLTLLAHSMGNYALGFGLERWFATPRAAQTLFDATVLAAADEPSNTFGLPNGGRLSDLWQISRHVTTYTNQQDVLMHASHIANGDWRLGFNGPANHADTKFFPAQHYVFVDCTRNEDFTQPLLEAPDRSHQYYRQSKTVRRDVARVLKGLEVPAGGRQYDTTGNVTTVPIPGA
jgi:esterase/lipase superfamily enzyme